MSESKIQCFAKNYSALEELQSDYLRDGFVSVKQLIPLEHLRIVQEDLISTFEEFSNDGSKHPIDSAIIDLNQKDKPLLYELHMASTKLLSLRSISTLLAKTVCEITKSSAPVYEISSGYLLGIPADSRLVYDFHQESNYMEDFDAIFNFHFPLLRQSTTENGTMSVLSKSHEIGTVSSVKERTSPDGYTNMIPTGIENITQKYSELHCILDPGDCVIFHKNLVHKSNFNSSNLCRPVGTARLTQSKRGSWAPKKSADK